MGDDRYVTVRPERRVMEPIKRLLEQSTLYVEANLAGLSPADDSVAIPNGGSSVNWLLGHIVYWRHEMIREVGGDPVWRDGAGRQYRGSPGQRRPLDFDPTRGLPLAELVAAFRGCDDRLKAALDVGSLSDDAATSLLRLLGHEIYHAGQLGALRRIAGRNGAL